MNPVLDVSNREKSLSMFSGVSDDSNLGVIKWIKSSKEMLPLPSEQRSTAS